MKKNKSLLLLMLITLVGLLLRIWQVDLFPAILNRDEAALAYNSYLLMETGQDEWGRTWPISLESFGDYKLLGYPLLLIPFLSQLGLSDLVVRLPSVLAGTILIILMYFISKKLELSEKYSLIVSLLVAISPVFVWYSRMAFEANVALTYLAGAWLLLLQIKQQADWRQYLKLGALLFLAILTYNTPLLLIPLLMVYVGLLFNWSKLKKLMTTEAVMLLVMGAGLFILWPVLTQKSGITIFTDETIWSQWITFRESLAQPWQTLIGNKYLYYSAVMFKNLIKSFSFSFLVTSGGSHPWHSLPKMGHIFSLTYVFFWAGLAQLLQLIWQARKKISQVKPQLSLLFLLLASLLPAIITVDAPHATRSLLFMLVMQVIAVSGVAGFLTKFKKQDSSLLGKILLVLILILGLAHAQQLFTHTTEQQQAFKTGFDQVVQQVEQAHPTESVAIVDAEGYHYILLAWYLKLSPETYFDTIIRQQPDLIGLKYGQQLSNYHFIAHPQDQSLSEPVLIQWSDQEASWETIVK